MRIGNAGFAWQVGIGFLFLLGFFAAAPAGASAPSEFFVVMESLESGAPQYYVATAKLHLNQEEPEKSWALIESPDLDVSIPVEYEQARLLFTDRFHKANPSGFWLGEPGQEELWVNPFIKSDAKAVAVFELNNERSGFLDVGLYLKRASDVSKKPRTVFVSLQEIERNQEWQRQWAMTDNRWESFSGTGAPKPSEIRPYFLAPTSLDGLYWAKYALGVIGFDEAHVRKVLRLAADTPVLPEHYVEAIDKAKVAHPTESEFQQQAEAFLQPLRSSIGEYVLRSERRVERFLKIIRLLESEQSAEDRHTTYELLVTLVGKRELVREAGKALHQISHEEYLAIAKHAEQVSREAQEEAAKLRSVPVSAAPRHYKSEEQAMLDDWKKRSIGVSVGIGEDRMEAVLFMRGDEDQPFGQEDIFKRSAILSYKYNGKSYNVPIKREKVLEALWPMILKEPLLLRDDNGATTVVAFEGLLFLVKPKGEPEIMHVIQQDGHFMRTSPERVFPKSCADALAQSK